MDLTGDAVLSPLPDSFGVQDAGALDSFNGYLDLVRDGPLEEGLGVMTYQTLRENTGNGPDGDVFFMRLRLGE
jgi:hypothetical protein